MLKGNRARPGQCGLGVQVRSRRLAAHKPASSASSPAKRAGTFAIAAMMACSLSFPQLAFATVRVDEAELAQGENAVGGGKATLADSTLDMVGVTAGELYTDEDLSVNFNGGNDIEAVTVTGSAEVELGFSCENEVEEVHAFDKSDVTINADGHNEFEEVEAAGQSSVTINVTGENDFEEIVGRDDASIAVRGTECQKKDVVNLGEGEQDTALSTEKGMLVVDHVTVSIEAEEAEVGSKDGDVRIDTSKIAKDDGNEYTRIDAGGKMDVHESVIDITGTVHSKDEMRIEHSDVKVAEPDSKYGDESPYRVYSDTGIELIDEENGEVEEGELDGETVWYVDTDDNDGKEVDLEADGDPAYYWCADEDPSQVESVPRTGDGTSPLLPMAAAIASAATAAFAAKRREEL